MAAEELITVAQQRLKDGLKKQSERQSEGKGRKRNRGRTNSAMAISGDLRFSATLGLYHTHPLRSSLPSSKVDFCSLNGGSSTSHFTTKWPSMATEKSYVHIHSNRLSGVVGNYKLSPKSFSREAESFLLDAINMNFFERINLAWKIIFPSAIHRRSSNARIAKQRLKMILFSDRCAVSDEAKRKIVDNIVRALSDFVEIESEDKVQLSVSADSDLGTIYSVTVPVRRVKPEYQDLEEVGKIMNVEYKDTEESDSADVRFDFFIPDERS